MAKKKPPPSHLAIARALGVTPTTLFALLSVKAGRSARNRGGYLTNMGLVSHGDYAYSLTEAGADLINRAREMGY